MLYIFVIGVNFFVGVYVIKVFIDVGYIVIGSVWCVFVGEDVLVEYFEW